jgi:FlaA1/EpsC-like NDP-sugar epimerase
MVNFFESINRITELQRFLILVAVDFISINLSFTLAFFIEGIDNYGDVRFVFLFLGTVIGMKFLIFHFFNLNKPLWRYASLENFFPILNAVTISTFLMFYCASYFLRINFVSVNFVVLDWTFCLLFIGGSRVIFKKIRLMLLLDKSCINTSEKTRVLIVGAGDAGDMVSKEFARLKTRSIQVVGFLDDSLQKQKKTIRNVPVIGVLDDLPKIVLDQNIHEVIIAIPSASGRVIRKISGLCNNVKVIYKITPALHRVIDGKIAIDELRSVRIEDLLGREVVESDMSLVKTYVKSKVILVTGGAGSIGSELCRQIIDLGPSLLILLDQSENGIYDRMEEFDSHHNRIQIVYKVCDISFKEQLSLVFEEFKPDIVFHSAAYKHVPIMENNPIQAIRNNILGTHNLVDLSVHHSVIDFVLISTDKAVRPSNVMGASKRLCEILIQSYNLKSTTKFSAVRFGNVLGSSGSVIPKFKKQIEAGVDITITHPDMNRYFMTIPEAARLVIGSLVLSKKGELYVLDMGVPVKIVDLAKDLIRLSGKTIGTDINIVYTGLRGGEKITEELFYDKANLEKTNNNRIYISPLKNIAYDEIVDTYNELYLKSQTLGASEDLKAYVMDITNELNQKVLNGSSIS